MQQLYSYKKNLVFSEKHQAMTKTKIIYSMDINVQSSLIPFLMYFCWLQYMSRGASIQSQKQQGDNCEQLIGVKFTTCDVY